MFIILLPFTRPIFIITAVVIMLSIIFCAVPAFILVLPVTNSGPVTASMAISDTAATGESGLQLIEAVKIPLARHFSNAPAT